MDAEQLIIFLLIGGIAGWLAGLILKGRGLGLIGNIIVGVVGAFLGGWLFNLIGIRIDGRWLGPLITALTGALVLLIAISFIPRK
jgi:uncharacterized membrane protein YeaQ/YmgE (transglycosylase-associated protein family)